MQKHYFFYLLQFDAPLGGYTHNPKSVFRVKWRRLLNIKNYDVKRTWLTWNVYRKQSHGALQQPTKIEKPIEDVPPTN